MVFIDDAKKILKKYNKQLKVVAEALLEYETLTGEEIKLLCQGKKINVSKKLKKTTDIKSNLKQKILTRNVLVYR